MGYGVVCQACGIEAPSKQITLRQNIGALVVRFHQTARGRLCKQCIHRQFWKMTPITLAIGWLGTISLVIAPIFVINNIVQYLMALGMPSVPPGATRPNVNNEVIARLQPHLPEIVQRMNGKEDVHAIAIDVAPRAGTTPGQVFTYVRMLAQAHAPVRAISTPKGAFPVIMLPQSPAAASDELPPLEQIEPPTVAPVTPSPQAANSPIPLGIIAPAHDDPGITEP